MQDAGAVQFTQHVQRCRVSVLCLRMIVNVQLPRDVATALRYIYTLQQVADEIRYPYRGARAAGRGLHHADAGSTAACSLPARITRKGKGTVLRSR